MGGLHILREDWTRHLSLGRRYAQICVGACYKTNLVPFAVVGTGAVIKQLFVERLAPQSHALLRCGFKC